VRPVRRRSQPSLPAVAGMSERTERLLGVVRRFPGRRVLVVADLVADEFIYGRVQRVSREAPVLILQYDGTDVRLGGGANAVHNIHTLSGRAIPVGVVGRDEHGARLRELLHEKTIATGRVFTEPRYVTPVKTRVLAAASDVSRSMRTTCCFAEWRPPASTRVLTGVT